MGNVKCVLTYIVKIAICFTFLSMPAFAAKDLPNIIGVATIGVGTSSYTSTVAYAPFLEKFVGVPVRALPSDSTKVSFSQIREKKALYGALSTSSVGVALQGERPYNVEGWGPQKIALVWMGYDGPFGIVVRKNSEIKSISDLKGKKFAWYTSSPAWMDGAKGALRFGGLNLDDVQLVKLGSYSACARAVSEGKADADYLSAVSSVTFEIAQGPFGIRYLPMPLKDKKGWDRFHQINPLIPSTVAESGVEEARGVPMANHVFCTTTYLDTNAESIYLIAKFFGEKYEQYKSAHRNLNDMSLKKMRALLDTRSIPVHPGTIRYLKEKKMWTKEDDEWNNRLLERVELYQKAWHSAVTMAKKKNITISMDNDQWNQLWNEQRSKLPVFKME